MECARVEVEELRTLATTAEIVLAQPNERTDQTAEIEAIHIENIDADEAKQLAIKENVAAVLQLEYKAAEMAELNNRASQKCALVVALRQKMNVLDQGLIRALGQISPDKVTETKARRNLGVIKRRDLDKVKKFFTEKS